MLKNEKGVTFIQLMIAIAIIGILATLVTLNYQTFVEKAHQAEAKTNLSSLFAAEKVFYAQYRVYYSRFDAIGFQIIGTVGYNIGFGSIGAALPAGSTAPVGTATCAQACAPGAGGDANPTSGGVTSVCSPGFATWTCSQLNGQWCDLPMSTTVPAGNQSFLAGAMAKLNPNAASAAQYDYWTIDNTQNLQNIVNGL